LPSKPGGVILTSVLFGLQVPCTPVPRIWQERPCRFRERGNRGNEFNFCDFL
jgi:hypothetical protein